MLDKTTPQILSPARSRLSRRAPSRSALIAESAAQRGLRWRLRRPRDELARKHGAGECLAATARVIPVVAAWDRSVPAASSCFRPADMDRVPGGPGTVVVADDDDDAPPRRRKIKKQTKKQDQKQQKAQKQIAQRGGFNPPPPGEQRFVPNEVLLNIAGSMSAPALNALARRHRLTQLESREFTLPPRRLARLRINDGRPVATVIRSLQQDASILAAQPNYYYSLEQGAAATADPLQYALGKMRLPEAHAIVKGDNIRVAVIDTTIDTQHPDLAGTVAATFDAIGKPDKPHSHGTGIAGVIAAHGKLMGVAPSVKVLAIAAFTSLGSKGSSMAILTGLEYAGTSGADVINMSFAGPSDPEMQLKIAALAQERRRAGRGRRQCRPAVAPALSRRLSGRHRRDRD